MHVNLKHFSATIAKQYPPSFKTTKQTLPALIILVKYGDGINNDLFRFNVAKTILKQTELTDLH